MSPIQPIVARAVDRSYGDRRILTAVDITVPSGARTGLIGENGVGKSTLLRILAGVEQPDDGTVTRPTRTGFLWQEAPVDEHATVGQLLDEYTAELRGIERELEDAATTVEGDPRRYEAALEAAERAELWTADARRDEILDVLGVGGFDTRRASRGATQPTKVGELSGGQRSRVALAGLLLSRPDALILDEPTNHLDDAAVTYLVSQLKGWHGPVLFASHDRAFLDEVATELVDLDPDRSRGVGKQSATRYGGTFTDYLAEKARERERWEQQFRHEQDELNRLTRVASTTAREVAPGRGPRDSDGFIHAFKGARVQATISRRVKDAERRRDVLEADAVRKPPPVLSFAGIPSGATALDPAEVLVDLTGVSIPGRLELDRLTITARDRVLVTGPNGAGKSTLLAVLAGELGESKRRKGLRFGMLRQDVRFADPTRTAREVYRQAVGERRAETTHLSDLGLVPPAQFDRPVGTLSVGQQRRLALATVIANPPHLFLLDEPSNHLSLALAVELEEALQSYPGAVVVASHDRWLRRRWVGRVVRLGSP
ncbi:ABC-F family ATP-binding cassette domain-containing protein [Pseudolysinimonas sp.]